MKLAEHFGDHPGVLMWHISNEYGGECHCPMCQSAFRNWLKKKYNNDIKEVNRRWNTAFWSHDYQNFDQIESRHHWERHPFTDWFWTGNVLSVIRPLISARLRFSTAGRRQYKTGNNQSDVQFPNRQLSMRWQKFWNVVSWDNYPQWHKGPERLVAMDNGMQHDIMRTLKKEPFILMESCPGPTNWQSVSKLNVRECWRQLLCRR